MIALITTALASLLGYWALRKPVLMGIDDENITQVYGRNLANGFGYVYTPDFERVEGATSPLWVAIHYLLYKITANPELYILAVSVALTALALYWTLGTARCVSGALGLPGWAPWIAVLAVAMQPNYFHWTVISMMDQGLWGAMALGWVFVLVKELTRPEPPRNASLAGVLLCVLCVLTRPEAMLLLPALLVIATVIVVINKGIGAAIRYTGPYFSAMLVTLAGLTAWRMAYFGYPLPNTYYAKVSSHPKDNILHGLEYVVSFLSSNILVVPGILAAVLGSFIALQSLLKSVKATAQVSAADIARLLIGGALAVIVASTILEGGDHFPGFRLLQPCIPLICVSLMFYVPLLSGWSRLTLSRAGGLGWAAALVAATFAASYASFAANHKEFREDFTIAWEGRRIGDLLNSLQEQPAPHVGVLPAGGIALSYNGRVVDLLGLNWAKMAHASGRRTGLPGHSAFNNDVFWEHRPHIMLPTLTDPANPINESELPGRWEVSLLRGLPNEKRFREEYRPALIRFADGEIFAYLRKDYLDRHPDDPRFVSLDWSRFRRI